MMNEQKQPKNPPPVEHPSAGKPLHPADGTPPGMNDADTKALPNNDRQQTETAADPAKR